MSADYYFNDVPLAHEMRIHVEQQAPFEADAFDRILNAMQHAYAVEGASERQALTRGLEQLRSEIEPCIRSPRGRTGRPPSRKAKRRVVAALDHLIAEGRARNG